MCVFLFWGEIVNWRTGGICHHEGGYVLSSGVWSVLVCDVFLPRSSGASAGVWRAAAGFDWASLYESEQEAQEEREAQETHHREEKENKTREKISVKIYCRVLNHFTDITETEMNSKT